jgi:hypothetical protein
MDNNAKHVLSQIKQSLDYVSWRFKSLSKDLDSLHRDVCYLLEEANKPTTTAIIPKEKT